MEIKNIIFESEKGGTGKTTLAIQARELLKKEGYKVSYYALDGQYDEAGFLGSDKQEDEEIRIVDMPGGKIDKDKEAIIRQSSIVVLPTNHTILEVQPLVRTLGKVKKLTQAPVIVVQNLWNRFNESKEYTAWLEKEVEGEVQYILQMPRSEMVIQALKKGVSVIDYAPQSAAAQAMQQLGEILKHLLKE